MPVTYTFVDTDVISATELNTNFADVLNETSGITVADLHADSGIVSTNLADRYTTARDIFHLQDDDGVYVFPSNTASPGKEVWRTYLNLRSGKSAFLCAVSFYCQDRDMSAAAGDVPVFWLARNGVVLGNGAFQIDAADTVRYFRNTNSMDDPLTSLSHDDYLTIGIGKTANNGTVSVTDLVVTLTYKFEIGA